MTLASCGQNSVNYSPSELQLFKSIGFDKQIFSDIKQNSNIEFTQMEISAPGYVISEDGEYKKTGLKKINGISFNTSENQSYEIVLNNKEKLEKKGYLIFISESGYETPSTVSIIKSTDKFDILRIQKTDGINFDIENKDVIERLKKWDELYGVTILGADYDWVELIFRDNIEHVSLFAEEVYNFCPDVVDQGVGDIEELKKIIGEEKRLFLWWD